MDQRLLTPSYAKNKLANKNTEVGDFSLICWFITQTTFYAWERIHELPQQQIEVK